MSPSYSVSQTSPHYQHICLDFLNTRCSSIASLRKSNPDTLFQGINQGQTAAWIDPSDLLSKITHLGCLYPTQLFWKCLVQLTHVWHIPFNKVQSTTTHMECVWNESRIEGMYDGIISSPIICSLFSDYLQYYQDLSLGLLFVCS